MENWCAPGHCFYQYMEDEILLNQSQSEHHFQRVQMSQHSLYPSHFVPSCSAVLYNPGLAHWNLAVLNTPYKTLQFFEVHHFFQYKVSGILSTLMHTWHAGGLWLIPRTLVYIPVIPPPEVEAGRSAVQTHSPEHQQQPSGQTNNIPCLYESSHFIPHRNSDASRSVSYFAGSHFMAIFGSGHHVSSSRIKKTTPSAWVSCKQRSLKIAALAKERGSRGWPCPSRV